MVECFLAKEDVAGSTPVSRSKHVLPHRSCLSAASPVLTAWRGTQVVRERSAKPLCVGSIPTRASTSLRSYRQTRLSASQANTIAPQP